MVPGSARSWIAVNAVNKSSLTKKMKTKNMTTLHLRTILLILSIPVLALTARADSIVFDTFGPGDTYSQFDAYEVGTFFLTPVESAAQFTAGASGNLATVYLGLL